MDEEHLNNIVRRYHDKDINFVKLKALIRRFLQNNPDADPETIDWTAVYDDSMEFDELIQLFEEQYPMYRWRQEQPMEKKEYEDHVVDYIIQQAEDLSEDSIRHLIDALHERLGLEPEPQPAEVQQASPPEATETPQTEPAKIEMVVQTAPPKAVVDMKLLAKYPWLPQARQFLKAFMIQNLPPKVIQRGKERILDAMERGELGVTAKLDNPFVELLSFPLAKAIVSTIDDNWLKKRWALAEAARCERLLHSEPDNVFQYLLSRLELRIRPQNDIYLIHFADYLKTAGDLLRDPSYKLVNQVLDKGWVYLRKARLTRIVRQHLYTSLYKSFENTPKLTKVPKNLEEAVAEILQKLKEMKPRQTPLKISGKTPPCMEAIRNRLADASHTENFAYAAFLINRGHSVEEIVREFSVRSDFKEDIAKYQVEHIAGLRGSRTKYRPPSCQTMKTLGLCVKNGELCPKNIKNPLQY